MSAVATAPAGQGRVTQMRVLNSEWIKFRTLRSSFYSLLAAIALMDGLAMLFSWGFENRISSGHHFPDAATDAITFPLRPYFVAQLAVGVLGVMVITGEYSTGMIRATLSAVPHRLPVLWAKAFVFAVVVLVLMEIASFVAFLGGEQIISAVHIQASLSTSGALRCVTGVGLYLTVVGLFAVAMGTIIRNTAGAIAAVFGTLLVLPVLGELLGETSWGKDIPKYLPSNAGQALLQAKSDPSYLAPWTGFGLFCAYTAVAMLIAAIVLKRRDA
jgi:ABC-type transport system involved in multi-copper enzyme maturation permease subunit